MFSSCAPGVNSHLKHLFTMISFLLSLFLLTATMSHAYGSPSLGVVSYYRMYLSGDGLTHIKKCNLAGLKKTTAFGTVQYVRDLGHGAQDIVITQQTGENPWHQCPHSQFVVTLSGLWYINTTAGDYVVMNPGDLLFQDDYKGLLVNGTAPVHYSGALRGPCNQMVMSMPEHKAQIGMTDPCAVPHA